MDLILEIKGKNEKELVDRLSKMQGISTVSILAYEGEVKG